MLFSRRKTKWMVFMRTWFFRIPVLDRNCLLTYKVDSHYPLEWWKDDLGTRWFRWGRLEFMTDRAHKKCRRVKRHLYSTSSRALKFSVDSTPR